MKRKISIVLLIALVFSLALFAFIGCSGGNDSGNTNGETTIGGDQVTDGNKQVPVYQGMTITSSSEHVISPLSYLSNKEDFDYGKDNGNHNGHFKGDHSGKNEDINKEEPFPDADGSIEDEIKSSLDVIGSPDTIYYAKPNEDIYINIHINNPDNFEIMSFTLNGKKYSSYMFEEGSDMETIVLKYNVGDSAGIVEYTIDAIKYIDGTEIKDVIIDGNKTVMAGIKTEDQVVASVSQVDIDTNAFAFNVNVKDNDELIAFSGGVLKAVVYDGFEIVAEKDLALGENSVSFEGLKTNTLYQYAVVGYYDDLSGEGFKMNVLYKDAFYTDSVVLFDSITIGQDSISFGFVWHEDHQDKAISALKLYKDENLVIDLDASATVAEDLLSDNTYKLVAEYKNGDNNESIYIVFTTLDKAVPEIEIVDPTKTQTSVGFEITETDTDNVGAVTKIELVHASGTTVAENVDVRAFADLLSNNEYAVKVTYTYDLNDGIGEQTIVKELAITTEAKATPDVTVTENSKTQTSIKFDVAVTDVDSVGEITKVELIHGENVQNITNLDTREFAGLLSNNEYTVKVTYTYDLNDGIGEQTIVKELAITTEAKAAPSFEVKNETITTTGIEADCDIADVDNILSYYKVELYKGETLVSENEAKEICFTSLDYYTDYIVRFTYKYDLNDGNGEQTKTYDHKFTTLPYIDVTDCNIANTSAVSEGDTIFMQVKLDNPLGMSIESVVINGETYAVTGSSTTNKIFVEIVYNGQFAGGDTYLKVDKVNAKIDDATLTVEPETELSDNVFINGKLEVLKIEFVNEDFEPIDWAFPSETVYVMITLDNPTGYTVDSINGTSNIAPTRIDDNHWYYKPATWGFGCWQTVSLDSLSYKNEYVEKTLTYSNMSVSCYVVESDYTVYISTPDDLKNMNGGYYYELTNDIDLSGLEWLGNSFVGVFDGKGYSIENMSFVGTIKNTTAYLGLFSRGDGIIQNLNIKEATIIAEVTADDGGNYSASCGAFIGVYESYNVILDNCTVDEYSILTVKNNVGEAYVGGLMGFGTATITNCSNAGSISATGSYACVGGLIGNGDVTFANCTNSGDVTATITNNTNNAGYVGGLTGQNWNGTFINCTNSGDVTATSADNIPRVGGLTGSVGGIVTFTNCSNSGDVTATAGNNSAYAGGLVGGTEYYDTTITITHCVNSGSVTATGNFGGYAGGLVGIMEYNTTATITHCVNSGDVTTTGCSAGGIAGYNSGTITNCTNRGSVTAKDDCAGGIAGYNSGTITNCTNSGSVTATDGHAGGIAVENYGTITNCTNSGSVTATDGYAGGIAVGNHGTITNCINSGSVTVTATGEYFQSYAGGIAGYNDESRAIDNSYSLTSGNGINGESCTVDQLNSKEFYTETLGWSEDVWDFSELDVENGKYPTLKTN